MERVNKVIDDAIYKLIRIVENEPEAKEYMAEEYGSLLEDDINLCLIDYIARYYAVSEDLVDLNS